MYACTFPVVVVHGLMALEDQISVKSLPLIVKCLKFCKVGCHNETTLKNIFYTLFVCKSFYQEIKSGVSFAFVLGLMMLISSCDALYDSIQRSHLTNIVTEIHN